VDHSPLTTATDKLELTARTVTSRQPATEMTPSEAGS